MLVGNCFELQLQVISEVLLYYLFTIMKVVIQRIEAILQLFSEKEEKHENPGLNKVSTKLSADNNNW